MRVSNTEKSYLDDPYTTEFSATVVSAGPARGGGHVVVLDRTFFYPESGGQTADAGTIGALPVIDIQEGEGESVLHTVGGDAAPAGTVTCTIDWVRRFDHMQQHTGQHVLSRAFIEVADLHTVSFHMGEDTCTIDLEGPFAEDAVPRAEALANRVVQENRPVTVRTVPVDELDESTLRRKVPEGVTNARLVTVADFDVIPCCGTHVRATGELGAIKVLKWEKVKTVHRAHFIVGGRALDDYAHKHAIVTDLANRFTTGVGEIGAKVDKLVAENQAQRKAVKAVSQRLAALEADALLAAAQAVTGVRLIASLVDGDGELVRALSSALKSSARTIAILGSADGTVVCTVSDDVDLDIAALAVPRARELGGSGGGKGAFAQLRLPAGASVSDYIEGIGNHVRSTL